MGTMAVLRAPDKPDVPIRPCHLSSAHMDWFCCKLKALFPLVEGLQSPESTCAVNRGARTSSQLRQCNGPRVFQVLHGTHHWTWVFKMDEETFYGDSLAGTPQQHHLAAMALLFQPEGKPSSFPFEYCVIQTPKQEDSVSCGVFTLACGFLLCSGMITPLQLEWVSFHASCLWEWLRQCMTTDHLFSPPFSYKPLRESFDYERFNCILKASRDVQPCRRFGGSLLVEEEEESEES